MNSFQLEINFDNLNDEERRLLMMQDQIDNMSESMRKVRKKLFGDMSELKKDLSKLKIENEFLTDKLYEMDKKKKEEWVYNEGGYLFHLYEFAS